MADKRNLTPGDERSESGTCGSPSSDCQEPRPDLVERVTVGCFSTILALFAAWLAWMARTFLDGGSWVEELAQQILDEVAAAVGLFAVTFFVWVAFKPPWLARLVTWAYDHLLKAFVVFLVLLLLPFFLFALMGGFQILCR